MDSTSRSAGTDRAYASENQARAGLDVLRSSGYGSGAPCLVQEPRRYAWRTLDPVTCSRLKGRLLFIQLMHQLLCRYLLLPWS